jgi:hypothetical protein
MNRTIQNPKNATLQLQCEDFVSAKLIDPGTTLVCEKGILWLTRSDDFTDYMLNAGEQMVINKKSNVLIEALSEARLSIIHTN